METFYDYYNNKVELSFEYHPFDSAPKHVWIICRYKNQWLLTKHRDRGLEFPGGKVERGEDPVQAAKREILEETGGIVEEIQYIGQYYVCGKADQLAKNIYFAQISKLPSQSTYYETEGPVLLDELPDNIKTNPSFSFMMKDNVLPISLAYIKREKM
ncbi:RNA deprotection pyrophosphohydrolase [Saliterribacillus persicus]|uniref:8-oxo-dGTPase n=1 Tax=Saliterribacillus persicus TaxID=930114 RepID=A0A368XFZ7_9BACI|nr:nucleoside triphosphatase YtkD [Saliterribacillus persicus]RCW66912.1 8-oxo-dGTPase [Saliterribacillus persicus]